MTEQPDPTPPHFILEVQSVKIGSAVRTAVVPAEGFLPQVASTNTKEEEADDGQSSS